MKTTTILRAVLIWIFLASFSCRGKNVDAVHGVLTANSLPKGAVEKRFDWGSYVLFENEVVSFAVYDKGRQFLQLSLPKAADIRSAGIGYGPVEAGLHSPRKEFVQVISIKDASIALGILNQYSQEQSYSAKVTVVRQNGDLEIITSRGTRLMNHFCTFGLWITLNSGESIYVDAHAGSKYQVIRKLVAEKEESRSVENLVYSEFFKYLITKYAVHE